MAWCRAGERSVQRNLLHSLQKPHKYVSLLPDCVVYQGGYLEGLCSAGSYGIYTLLDMHQDVLSDKFCGEGIPDWAVDTGSELRKKQLVPIKPEYAYLFSDAKGFPFPVDEPYKVDPTTGYPTPEVMYTYVHVCRSRVEVAKNCIFL